MSSSRANLQAALDADQALLASIGGSGIDHLINPSPEMVVHPTDGYTKKQSGLHRSCHEYDAWSRMCHGHRLSTCQGSGVYIMTLRILYGCLPPPLQADNVEQLTSGLVTAMQAFDQAAKPAKQEGKKLA